MSLILDALRKLERQKAEHEPIVLVVGSVPWGGTSRRRQLLLAIGAAAVLASGVFVGWLLRPAAPAPAKALPAPARADRATRALPDPAPAAPTPDPAAASPPVPSPAASISVAPGVEGIVETAPGAALDELRLSAISQRDGRPVALINDRLVFEGDSFDGVRVLRIGETEVEVEVRGVRRILRF